MIVCDGCGESLRCEVLIPSEIWEQIANGRYALCPGCVDAACTTRTPCIALYHGERLYPHVSIEIVRAISAWRPGPACVAREGVGNPKLYGGMNGVFA